MSEEYLIIASAVQIVMTAALGVFLNTKARNLAQRQDLEILTSITEGVKGRLQHDALVCKAQFEVEFKLMQSVWDASRRLERQFVESFPSPNFGELTKDGYEKFLPVQIAFLDALEGSRPFISTSLFNSFMVFDALMVRVKGCGLNPYSDREIQFFRDEVKSAFQCIEKNIRQRILDLRSLT